MSTLAYLALAIVVGGIVGGAGSGRRPYAAPACVLAAVIGAVTVSLPLGDQGPRVGEVAIIPAAAGAFVGALLVRMTLERRVPRT